MSPYATRLSMLISTTFSTPRFIFLRGFFANWLKLDLTTLAAALTIYGTLSGALKDLQGIALKIYWWFTRFFTASISIASNDRLNREILNWLGSQILTRQGTRILTARTEDIRSDAYYSQEKTTRNDYDQEKRVPIRYLPTFGTTWFIHECKVFLVRRISTQTMFSANTPQEYNAAPEGDEPLVVMVLGRSVQPIKRFFETCRNFADKQRESFITIRASKNHYGRESWDTTILRPIRPLSTVHFDELVKDELVTDIKNYLDPNTRRFYTRRGIPYRRGYLLHGPPGTGKTSLSLGLAGFFGLELYLCHLPSIREDNELERLFSALPPRCIVLLEDIDAVGAKRHGHEGPPSSEKEGEEENKSEDESDDEEKSYTSRARCTLSGLLNVLDGVASQEGRIILMTSNLPQKLDKALVRPGRIDKMICLGNISKRSAELMFLRMYAPEDTTAPSSRLRISDGELQNQATEFSSYIPDNVFTPAQLQGYLLNRRESPARALGDVSGWAVDEKKRLDDEKRRAKEASAWRAKKRKAKTLDRLAKDLSKMSREDMEIESELEVLAASVKRDQLQAVDVSKNKNTKDQDLKSPPNGTAENTSASIDQEKIVNREDVDPSLSNAETAKQESSSGFVLEEMKSEV